MDPIDFWSRKTMPFYGGPIGSHATLVLLAQLGLPSSPQLARACENLIQYGQQADGSFTYGTRAEDATLCNTGTSVVALSYFGFADDEGVQRAGDFLVARAHASDGLACSFCDDAVCKWGVTKALTGLAALQSAQATGTRAAAIDRLADTLLSADYDFEGRDAKWLRFGFPLGYESDLVELCDVLARTGFGTEPRFQRLMDRVTRAATDDGRWIKSYGTRALQVEKRGKPSKWITVFALRAIRHASSSMAAAARTDLRRTSPGR
jgi:hypothetical protein